MNRRLFLQQMGLGTGLAMLHGMPALANPYRGPLSVQLYTVRDAVAKNLEGSLARLAALGYQQLELFGYDGRFFGKTAKEFKAILDRVGLKAISSHHTTGWVMKGKGTLSDGWEQAVEDLHQVGVNYMVCAYLFPEERSKAHYQQLIPLLQQSAKACAKAGIRFAYHNHDFEFERQGDFVPYDFILSQTPKDLVYMEADLYWFTRAGVDPVRYFEQHPGRFPLWHVKDMDAKTKDFMEVGKGSVNFDRIFAARAKAGLQHWFVEQDESKGDPFDSLKISRDYLAGKDY